MAKQQSVAPKERINIVYKPATNATEEVELPLKMLIMGDFSGQNDPRMIEDRKPVSINKDNFNEVLAGHEIELNLQVPNQMGQEATQDELNVRLKLTHMKDFEPDRIAEQVPELKQLLQLREALIALRGPLGNVPAFRKKLQELVQNKALLTKLYEELGMAEAKEQS